MTAGRGQANAGKRGQVTAEHRERAISEHASAQHAVISLDQLRELGLSGNAVAKRASAGRLHRLHYGVYAVVDPRLLTLRGRIMAAVLACGPGAVASHRSAAVLHELGLRRGGWVDVTAPAGRGRRRDGIRAHSDATVGPADVVVIDAIPATSLARTMLDVAEDAAWRELERALDRAELQRTLDMRALDDVLARAAGRRGTPVLAGVLDEHRAGSTMTRSELEEAFLEICRGAGCTPDAVNAWIPFDGGGAEADFLWRAARLVAEVDGRDVHATRRAFERDRSRDQRLAVLGWRVVRFTWRQVTREPAAVARTLHALVGARS